MPRCYMVKKQNSNKYQQQRERDERWSSSSGGGGSSSEGPQPQPTTMATMTPGGGGAPDSPTEACVAPPYYTPLTSRLNYSRISDYDPHDKDSRGSAQEPIIDDTSIGRTAHIRHHHHAHHHHHHHRHPTATTDDGGIFRARSAEETEAAHDLLSLSQSLPPLQAPGVVTIHHTLPADEHEPMPYTYRPLSPESSAIATAATTRSPVGGLVYPSPIVYVVQVPAAPTPPTSECSSDADNLQICIAEEPDDGSGGSGSQDDDIIILPLSPEPEMRGMTTVIVSPQVDASTHVDMPDDEDIDVELVHDEEPLVPVRHHSVITSTNACSPPTPSFPKRSSRRRAANRKSLNRHNNNLNNNNSNHKNNNDTVGEEEEEEDEEEVIAEGGKQKSSKTVKPVVDEDEEAELMDDAEHVQQEDSTSAGSVEDPPTTTSKTRYVCTECGKQYATSSNLSRHKQTHRSLDSQMAKKCMTCGKAYVSMPALAMHVLTHKLAHACGICGKQFSRPWLLQGHLRSHTGEKPYGCAHCGKSFADRSNLRAHMQTHSADKNYSCAVCKKTFALKSYLNKHQESACRSDGGDGASP